MRLSQFILSNLEEIMKEWESFAGTILPEKQLDKAACATTPQTAPIRRRRQMPSSSVMGAAETHKARKTKDCAAA